MSKLKTATSALTAAVLVTGIGLAWAQTDEQVQPTEPMTAATAEPISEQTPADPNAVTPVDSTTAAQQAMPADDPARTTPPVDSTAPLTSDSTTRSTTDSSYNNNANTTAASTDMSTTGSTYEPAPRADRN
ncbi:MULTISPECIES: hypothetical protein [unclassified Roseateles]|uniref:hypothetical protein n=1 Tax=unclassified Roseateles TaxID=2626991 RepID=UPI0006FCD82C|nr:MULTISPECIES: hypothetical protein [unclassified Roseateles]KQW46614.1 hypothetical protein ASC81_09505 [Pelomonas sp. Root405]KRA73665.1 hypothetical protein ASD88_09505 [Pelomonas sp. Root662]